MATRCLEERSFHRTDTSGGPHALYPPALPLVAAGCAQNYDAYGRPYGGYSGGYDTRYPTGSYYSQDTGQYPTSSYSRDFGPSSAYASGYGYNEGYYGRPYYGGENCGTPDEPKGCPPMPRVPLDYYPESR